MSLIRILRNDASAEVTSFVRFLTVNLPEPAVLPILQPHPVSPFAAFSNPPFFGDIFSPCTNLEEGEDYFDALDTEEVTDEEAPEMCGSREAADLPQEHQDPPLTAELSSRRASDNHPISPIITPEPPGEDNPEPRSIERPPIYRVWSY
jgi:hypothetical protein